MIAEFNVVEDDGGWWVGYLVDGGARLLFFRDLGEIANELTHYLENRLT